MPRRPKYQLPDSRRSLKSAIHWLLALAVLGFVAWIWWRAATPPTRRAVDNPDARPATNPAAGSKPVAATRPASAPDRSTPRPGSVVTLAAGNSSPRQPLPVLEAQVALDRLGISCGSLDGILGSQTRSALRAFQGQAGLLLSGELDDATRARLMPVVVPLTNYTVATNDLLRLQPVSQTWLGKSQQTALDYETILECVAEKSHAHPDLVRRLNPEVDWTNVVAGTVLRIPCVTPASNAVSQAKAAFITISLTNKVLEAFDAQTNLLLHFPCSIARRVEKRPVGELHVTAIAPNPNYTFDPEVFPESPEAQQLQRKLILPPGPNNPVGTVWISLDRAGYGIHGTPSPEQVGRTESHGCFRLANWNAEKLLSLVWVGMPVYVQP